MRIWVDVYSHDGTRLGEGPITSVMNASVVRALDGAGSVSFDIPLTDERGRSLLVNERRARIYVEEDDAVRLLGSGVIRNLKVSATPGGWRLSADGPDDLEALKRVNTLLGRKYSNQPITTVAAALVALASGWTVNASGAGNTSIRFDGVSVLKALQALVDQHGLHLRLGTDANSLEVGAFGASTGLRLVNAERAAADIYANDEVALIETLSLVQDSEAVANWLIPIGAGEGTAALTLRKSTRTTPYPIQNMVGPNGKRIYYLADSASIASYGQIEKVGTFKNIAPLSNTDADIRNAANALYDAAAAWLQRYSVRQDTYRCTLKKTRVSVRPGDKVRLIYKGIVERDGQPYTFLDVDAEFWVLKVTERVGLQGLTTTLEIASVDRYELDSAQVVIGALEAITLRNVSVQPYPSKSNFVRYEEIDNAHSVKIPIKITDATLELTRAQLTIKTRPLRSTATAAAAGGGTSTTSSSGGGTTATSSSGGGTTQSSTAVGLSTGLEIIIGGNHRHDIVPHSHDVSIPSHTHEVSIPSHSHNVTIPSHTHSLTYGIYDDTQYPQTVRLFINGTNRTGALGGPWATSGGALNVELDITEYLAEAAGGLRQEHELEITCGSGQGTVEVLVELFEVVQAIPV